jgi:hypothetical protein
MVGASLPDGYSLRTHVLLSDAPEGCVSVITHTSHRIRHMDNYEYVCIYNDAPIFFKDMDEASCFSRELEAKLIAEGKEMPCLLFCSID